jgi:hypothetical protein
MDAVDFFLFPPRPFPKETKLVKWDLEHGGFAVFTKKGYHVWSHVTTIEDVSYVSTPSDHSREHSSAGILGYLF